MKPYTALASHHLSDRTEPLRPTALKGLEVCARFGSWLLYGSRELDRYIVVPESKLSFVTDLTKRMNGTCSLDELASDMGQPCSRVSRVYQEFHHAGLTSGSTPQVGLGRFAMVIHKWSLPKVPTLLRKAVARAFAPLAWITTACIAAGIVFGVWQPHIFLLSAPTASVTKWQSLLELVAVFGTAVSVHELAHMVAAGRFRLFPQSIIIVAYLGVIPFLLLRIPGLYLLSTRRRIVVWLAGVWCNLALCAAAGILASNISSPALHEFVNRFAVTNLTLAALNVLPLLPTDGYFVMTTLLRQPNLRKRSQREAFRLLQGRTVRSGLLVAYWFASIAFTAFLASRNVHACYEIVKGIGLWWFTLYALTAAILLTAKFMGGLGYERQP